MRDKFGLEFRIIDSKSIHDLRKERFLHANPWTHFPRLITSIDFLKRVRPLRLFSEILPLDPPISPSCANCTKRWMRPVAHAYEWDDLALGHGFHETKQELRYTISEQARREVLDRLLLLNHERHEEEVKTGLFEAKGTKGKGAKKGSSGKGGKSGKVGVSDGGLEQGALF